MKRELRKAIRNLRPMPETLVSLSEAEGLGYGKADTLKCAIYSGNLRAKLVGKSFITTVESLEEAGYPKGGTSTVNSSQ